MGNSQPLPRTPADATEGQTQDLGLVESVGHTPGPWVVKEDSYGAEIWIGGSSYYTRTISAAANSEVAWLGGDGVHGA